MDELREAYNLGVDTGQQEVGSPMDGIPLVTLTPRSAETDRLWTPRTTYGATEGEHVQDSATVPGIPHRELIKHSHQLLAPPSDPVDSEDWNR